MAEERVERRLAAILAADVVGYGRLIERDEAGTLAALKARPKDVLEPLVAKHDGRTFKVVGDGPSIEFVSPVNVVECAVAFQEGMAAANRDEPEERHIVLRMGVKPGDVIVKDDDLFGDGVNIAAGLESLAEPGTILVLRTANNHTLEAMEFLRRCIDSIPRLPTIPSEIACDCHFMLGEYDKVIDILNRHDLAAYTLPIEAAAYAQLGRIEDSKEGIAAFHRSPGPTPDPETTWSELNAHDGSSGRS